VYIDDTGDEGGSGCPLDRTVNLQLDQEYLGE